MKRIVFIESGLSNPNNNKRMEEFKSLGYEVVAYAFCRESDAKVYPQGIDFHVIGVFSSKSSYLSRVGMMRNGIRDIISKHRKEDCVYYLFGGDVAVLFPRFASLPYIFEEADMTHQNISNSLIRNYLEHRIKRIIKKSVLSTFCSEGFLQFHFGNNRPDNVMVIPNRLHPDVLKLNMPQQRQFNDNCIQFGFVGAIRYQTIYSFAAKLLKNFPQHQFHFFGNFALKSTEDHFSKLSSYPNCHFHGPFKSPVDLPGIYSQIDVVLSAYDVRGINPQYAEPNKLYEAIYFEKPIIVSSNSFLADKVARLGIGYDVDALDEDKVVALVKSINKESIEEKKTNIRKIDKQECVSNNEKLFAMLEQRLNA